MRLPVFPAQVEPNFVDDAPQFRIQRNHRASAIDLGSAIDSHLFGAPQALHHEDGASNVVMSGLHKPRMRPRDGTDQVVGEIDEGDVYRDLGHPAIPFARRNAKPGPTTLMPSRRSGTTPPGSCLDVTRSMPQAASSRTTGAAKRAFPAPLTAATHPPSSARRSVRQ